MVGEQVEMKASEFKLCAAHNARDDAPNNQSFYTGFSEGYICLEGLKTR